MAALFFNMPAAEHTIRPRGIRSLIYLDYYCQDSELGAGAHVVSFALKRYSSRPNVRHVRAQSALIGMRNLIMIESLTSLGEADRD